jgi:hypothetical protein
MQYRLFANCAQGATKVKLAAPKSKYIEHLLMATQVFIKANIPNFRSEP